jgi:MscS family membrane protein
MQTHTARIVALLICAALVGVGAQGSWAQEAASVGSASTANEIVKPSIEDEVQGTCATPREAMLQLLYWLQAGHDRWEPERAAACMAGGALPRTELGTRAYQLKRTLDVRGIYIDIEALPRDPNYIGSGNTRQFRLPQLPEVELVKVGSRWLISESTVRRVPELYQHTVPPLVDQLVQALPRWLHNGLLGIEIWQLAGIFILIVVAVAVQRLTVYVVSTYVQSLAGKLSVGWIKSAAGRIHRPVGGLSMALVFHFGLPWLQFPVRISQAATVTVQLLAVTSAVWLGYRLIDVLCDWLSQKANTTDTKLDDQLVPMVRKVLKVFAAVIGGIFILQNLNVNVGSLLAGLGLGGLAFALAAKDSIANLFGSLVIFIDKPFQIGDSVVIGSVEGVVEEVGFRTTRVRTFYNSLVTVPNAQMTNVAIDNYGMRRYRRYKTTLSLAYSTPAERVQAFCEGVRAIIQALPGMRKDFYLVEFTEYGASSLDVLLYCFMDVPDWAAELRTRSFLNLEILRLAERLGVSFAFPTRTLHIDSQATPAPPPQPAAMEHDQLAAVVQEFGPGGGSARPRGVALTYGYDPGDAAR